VDVDIEIRHHGHDEVILKSTIKPDITLLNIKSINDVGGIIGKTLSWVESKNYEMPLIAKEKNYSKDGLLAIVEPEVKSFFDRSRTDIAHSAFSLLLERKLYIRSPKFISERFAKIGPAGTVITQDNNLILETTEGGLSTQEVFVKSDKDIALGEVISKNIDIGICERQINVGLIRRNIEAVSVQKAGWGNYAIWTTECLVRAYLARNDKELSKLPIIFKTARRPNDRIVETFREGLCHLEIDDSNLLIAEERWTRVETLHVPTATDPRLQSRVSFELTYCCDEIVRKVAEQANVYRGKKIYISRSDAKIRRITNEVEIGNLLTSQFGFEIHSLTGMKFSDQVALFASASIIVGPHGAGLANCVFATSSNAALIEITTDDIIERRIFRDICCVKNIRYGMVIGRKTDLEKGDFYVEAADVGAAVAWATG
jgi:hypothetical protein